MRTLLAIADRLAAAVIIALDRGVRWFNSRPRVQRLYKTLERRARESRAELERMRRRRR